MKYADLQKEHLKNQWRCISVVVIHGAHLHLHLCPWGGLFFDHRTTHVCMVRLLASRHQQKETEEKGTGKGKSMRR
jgi:hypothetical protein